MNILSMLQHQTLLRMGQKCSLLQICSKIFGFGSILHRMDLHIGILVFGLDLIICILLTITCSYVKLSPYLWVIFQCDLIKNFSSSIDLWYRWFTNFYVYNETGLDTCSKFLYNAQTVYGIHHALYRWQELTYLQSVLGALQMCNQHIDVGYLIGVAVIVIEKSWI